MSFSFSFAFISCPSCGAQIMPSGKQIGDDPEHLMARCGNCRKLVEMKKDPASGEWIVKAVKPS